MATEVSSVEGVAGGSVVEGINDAAIVLFFRDRPLDRALTSDEMVALREQLHFFPRHSRHLYRLAAGWFGVVEMCSRLAGDEHRDSSRKVHVGESVD